MYVLTLQWSTRFPVRHVKELIRTVLEEHLRDNPSYDTEMGKRMADDVRNKLKGVNRTLCPGASRVRHSTSIWRPLQGGTGDSSCSARSTEI